MSSLIPNQKTPIKKNNRDELPYFPHEIKKIILITKWYKIVLARSFNKPEQNKYTSSNKIKIDSSNSFRYNSEQNNLFLSLLDINI